MRGKKGRRRPGKGIYLSLSIEDGECKMFMVEKTDRVIQDDYWKKETETNSDSSQGIQLLKLVEK